MNRHTTVVLAASFSLVALVGCSKLKSLAGKGDDAGAATASGGGGGGLLGGLLKPSAMEGAIEVAIEDKKKVGDNINLHVEVKPDNLRVDFPQPVPGKKSELDSIGTGYAVMKAAEKKIFVVLDKQKQVILIDLNKPPTVPGAAGAGGAKPGAGGATAEADAPKVTKTGKTETVAGYDCEDWDIQSKDGSKATVCMAKAFTFMNLALPGLSGFGQMVPGGGGQLGLMAQLFSGNLPLKMVAFDKVGAPVAEVKATKIDKKTIDDSRFTTPPTYTTVTLEQMFSGALRRR
jgi:hypothetical protein